MQSGVYKMTKTIEHAGIVKRINNGNAEVMSMQMSACSSCHAKSACTVSDSSEKIITVPINNDFIKEGDSVTIEGTTAMGFIAVFYAFVLPFILVMIMLISIVVVTDNEVMASLISLFSLCPYYLILYLFKNKMKNKFVFNIRKY